MNPNNNLENEVKNYMGTYFKAIDNRHYLTGDNSNLVAQTESIITSLPEGALKTTINNELDNYYEHTKEIGNVSSMNNADTLRQGGPVRALVKKEETPISSRAAFINLAILLYGVVNIGIILAIAFMK